MPEPSHLIDDIGDMLMDCELFRDFPPADLKTIARYFSVSRIVKDEVIFEEGDDGQFMAILSSGKVAVLKANQDDDNVHIATLAHGRSFGEMAVLDGERRSATCQAESDCILLTLSKESLDKMITESPRTGARVIRAVAVALSRRLRMADGKLVDHHI
jgi:CRP/FNR family transcriptional regulator, cyclic AMP receptor protein